jgi:hypothetical protein
MDEALEHIARYGSNHTEAILTTNHAKAMRFLREVDASLVVVNASTRFNDGNQLGLGAEIGISTSKLHAYGPMGLKELTSTKFVALGEGQCEVAERDKNLGGFNLGILAVLQPLHVGHVRMPWSKGTSAGRVTLPAPAPTIRRGCSLRQRLRSRLPGGHSGWANGIEAEPRPSTLRDLAEYARASPALLSFISLAPCSLPNWRAAGALRVASFVS